MEPGWKPRNGGQWYVLLCFWYFADPLVSIHSSNAPVHNTIDRQATYLTDLHCSVDVAAGKPHFTIEYSSGLKAVNVIQETSDVLQGANGLGFIHHAIMRLPEYDNATCTVTDDLGTYVATETVISKG